MYRDIFLQKKGFISMYLGCLCEDGDGNCKFFVNILYDVSMGIVTSSTSLWSRLELYIEEKQNHVCPSSQRK